MENNQNKPRIKPIIEAADNLSLGISVVVAILLGVGIGFWLKNITSATWTLWIGVAIGIAAAILNIYKAYSKQYKDYQRLAKERDEKIKNFSNEDEDEEDIYS